MKDKGLVQKETIFSGENKEFRAKTIEEFKKKINGALNDDSEIQFKMLLDKLIVFKENSSFNEIANFFGYSSFDELKSDGKDNFSKRKNFLCLKIAPDKVRSKFPASEALTNSAYQKTLKFDRDIKDNLHWI